MAIDRQAIFNRRLLYFCQIYLKNYLPNLTSSINLLRTLPSLKAQ